MSRVQGRVGKECALEIYNNLKLEQVDKTNATLQNPRLDVNTTVAVLTSLKTFIALKNMR